MHNTHETLRTAERVPPRRLAGTGLITCLVLLGGCLVEERPPVMQVREVPTPAAAGSQAAHLTITRDGRLLMSWLEPEGTGHAFRMAEIGAERAAPHTIARGDDFFVNWADVPSILALPDGSLAAHWLVRSGPGTYAYDVRIATSRDRGATWSEPIAPHGDGTETEHGFVSLFPLEEGAFGAVWLDGRDYARADAQQHRPEMALRFARVENGAAGEEVVLDRRVCECCATGAAPAPGGGHVVVYRDRSSEEIRDIARVVLRDGTWSAPAPAADDGWRIEGCPVNGPALAGDGRRLALAWYTAAETPSVLFAWGAEDGTFGTPIRVDEGAPLGRAAVLLLPTGGALVAWLERVGGEAAEIRARRVAPNGRLGTPLTLAHTSAQRLSGFPRLAMGRDHVYLAWTDAAVPQVRLTAARLR
jgi:hypothetical protein